MIEGNTYGFVCLHEIVKESNDFCKVDANDCIKHDSEQVENDLDQMKHWVVYGIFDIESLIRRIELYYSKDQVNQREKATSNVKLSPNLVIARSDLLSLGVPFNWNNIQFIQD